MQLLTLTLPDLAENLALDEALLLEAEEGRGEEVLRLWEWPKHAVVLGAAGQIEAEVDAGACVRDHIPIRRRASGGGTVLLGEGCLLYSLVLSYARAEELTQIGSSYRYILGRVRQALDVLVPGIELAGTSDLAVGGRKFSGNSQQRKRGHLLHHGTLLYRFELGRVGRYLKPPPRQPDYRQGRDHGAFLMNLPLEAGQIEGALRGAWQANDAMSDWPAGHVRQLTAEKYALDSWTWRR
jgi:lipoate-protein ligase A